MFGKKEEHLASKTQRTRIEDLEPLGENELRQVSGGQQWNDGCNGDICLPPPPNSSTCRCGKGDFDN